ncbi:hypothetical protein ACQPZP_13650 [Spirillospora sp. CA-142024]|uniref:hypothetical protein n=1 Tax=Spirillospora sp. CA-142024 TaxID=3240036 RepID=UPI003D8B00A4
MTSRHRFDPSLAMWPVCLVMVTGVSAFALVPAGIRFGSFAWDDMTTDRQMMALWELSAAAACTAGSLVGQLCALVAGMVAGARRMRPVVAVGSGMVLGLIDVGLAVWAARPRLNAWARTSPLLELSTGRISDTEPLAHGPVLTIVLITLVIFPVAAGCGLAVARAPLPLKVLLVPVVAVILFFIRLVILFSTIDPS